MCIHLHKASLNFLRRLTKKGFSDKYKGDKIFTKIRTNCMQLFSTLRQFIMTLSNTQKHHKWIQKYMTLVLWSLENRSDFFHRRTWSEERSHELFPWFKALHLYLFTQNISELSQKTQNKGIQPNIHILSSLFTLVLCQTHEVIYSVDIKEETACSSFQQQFIVMSNSKT